ncbi:hypothetical protein [uncultured Algibacter sp.]|uniref:hypothetical protein n=1 Tax=uncultured Algibacter sp. TaxID=298659 RepID=UPI0032166088
MEFLKKYLIIFFISIQFSCVSQNHADLKNRDLQLLKIYQKFYNNRHDYAGKKGEARDSILIRFKSTLIKTLGDKTYINMPFDSLSTRVKIVSSADKKLNIFSWDELNGGTWHIYNSAYQFRKNDTLYSGILSLNDNETLTEVHNTDVTHFKIYKIEDNKYLVKGYGTHGSGKEFFVYRLLSFKNEKIQDCNKCFNGNNRFVYEISRGDDLEPLFDIKNKEIIYHELKETYVQGNLDEPSGFMESTGKILKLKYKAGLFIELNN